MPRPNVRPAALLLVFTACTSPAAAVETGGGDSTGTDSGATDEASSGAGSEASSGPETSAETSSSTAAPSDTTQGGSSSGTVAAYLRGGAQKGPLLLGSTVSASRLDDTGAPTGVVFMGQLDDDHGRFDLGEIEAGVYLLEADGFHYDEVRGDLSGAPIVLRAVVAVPSDGEVYINAFTHLSHRRVLALLDEGVAIAEAIAQAEVELAAALPIGPAAMPAPATGAEMTLLDGDDTAARYLFATSAVFGQAAVLAAGGVESDAHLQQLLANGAAELGSDGAFSASTTDALIAGLLALDVAAVEAHLAGRLIELGIDAPVPQLDALLDQDLDGVMNDADLCDLVVDPEQLDADVDGLGDACDPYPMGEPQELVGELELPWSFAVTSEWIYFTSFGDPAIDDGGLWRVATTGGDAELVSDEIGARDVAASDTTVWWSHLGGISRVSLDGSMLESFTPSTARSVVVDASRLLWVNEQGVYSSPLDVAAPEVLVAGGGPAYEAAANEDTFYWTTATTVEAVRKDGSEAWTVAAGMQYAAGVAADADDVFWLDVGTCTIHRAPANGGDAAQVWASDDPNDLGHVCTAGTSQIALDETHVYWGGQDALSRVAREGGPRQQIAGADAVWYARDVHVDDTDLYWLNNTNTWQDGMNSGRVMRLAKPR